MYVIFTCHWQAAGFMSTLMLFGKACLGMTLVSVVSAALFHVLFHHIEETVAIALLSYITVRPGEFLVL